MALISAQPFVRIDEVIMFQLAAYLLALKTPKVVQFHALQVLFKHPAVHLMPGSSSATPPSAPVVYSIASSTPHSGRYSPDNIIEDKPLDQSSRWSGAFQGNANQWIVLKLNSLAILSALSLLLPSLLIWNSDRDYYFWESEQRSQLVQDFELKSPLDSSQNVSTIPRMSQTLH